MDLKKTPPFQTGLLVSLAAHLGLFAALSFRWGRDFPPVWPEPQTIEIDLTRPHRLTSDPTRVHRSPHPGTGAPLVTTPQPATRSTAGVAAQGGAWTLPTSTTVQTPPVAEGTPLSVSTASTGTGATPVEAVGLGGLNTGGEGEVDWIYLTDPPRLLNRAELLKSIQRFYPPEERQANREGRVVTELHLTREGRASRVDIVDTPGNAFAAAARRVLAVARFSPAKAGDRPVAVKLRWALDFHLKDEE